MAPPAHEGARRGFAQRKRASAGVERPCGACACAGGAVPATRVRMSKTDIFISYAHQDGEVADRLARRFLERGWRCSSTRPFPPLVWSPNRTMRSQCDLFRLCRRDSCMIPSSSECGTARSPSGVADTRELPRFQPLPVRDGCLHPAVSPSIRPPPNLSIGRSQTLRLAAPQPYDWPNDGHPLPALRRATPP